MNAKITIHLERSIGRATRELYSSFVEHIGRAVYGGIYQPGHPEADEDGFRRDVIGLVRELGVPYIRYPGGNFVSSYCWKNGIGPKEERPVLPDVAWRQLEPNEVGVDEFVRWCGKVGAEPIMAVNLGTGTPQEAFELLQYCNGTKGYWAELRKKNGHQEPYNIRYWCLGNEMDGDWQVGHKTAEEYSKLAKMTAMMMKMYDPTVKLIFCGSSSFDMSTFPAWDRTVLTECFDLIDYISCHRYYSYDKKSGKNLPEFLGSYADCDRGLTRLEEVIAEVKTAKGSSKDVKICFDEWNVWYMGEGTDLSKLWEVGVPREETVYSALDAVVVASLLGSIVNHAGSVGIACLAQLVNVIAPIYISGGRAVKQTIFYPFKYASERMRGEVYRCEVEAEPMDAGKQGKVMPLACAFCAEGDRASLLVCNLGGEACTPQIALEGYRPEKLITFAADPLVKNTGAMPEAAVPAAVELQQEPIEIQPYSWNIVCFRK